MASVSVASRPMASARRGSSPSVPPWPSGRAATRTRPFSVRSIFDTFMIQSIPRSWRSEPWLTVQPWLSSPSRFSSGTSTSVKKTSLKSAWCGSVSSGRGRHTMPGVRMSMISVLMPRCLGASGSVRT